MNQESAFKKERAKMAELSKTDKSVTEYNKSVSMSQQIRDLHNSAVNRPIIKERLDNGTAHDLSCEGTKEGKTVVLVSSGPSLDQAIPFLMKWDGDIICMCQQSTTLMFHGIEPTYIIATDIRTTYEMIQAVDWSKTKTKLIAPPGCWHSLYERWPNDILLYRVGNGQSQGFHKFIQSIIFSDTQDTHVESLRGDMLLTPMIPTEITIYASGAAAVVALASGFKYSKVLLAGFDFGAHKDISRFKKWDKGDTGEWEIQITQTDFDYYSEQVGDVYTNNIQRYYKRQFLAACRFTGIRIYTLDTVPNMPFPTISHAHALSNKYPRYKKHHVARLIDDYLAENGMYGAECENGFVFFELDSLEKIRKAMTLQNRVYRCDNCMSAFQFTDDADYTGFQCDNCSIGKLVQNAPVDVEKNIKRLKKYFEE
jgi:DNA-directed RNA polymerase subunit RPC12/RpoP